MSRKSDLYASLSEILQALNLQEEDVERIVKEVTLLSSARVASPVNAEDDPTNGSGNSPGRSSSRRGKNKNEKETIIPSKEKKRERLVTSLKYHLLISEC
jgi:hypothetical protein